MFLNLLILSLILVGIAFLGMAVSVLFKKNGEFPDTGVGHNPEMRKRGITCARSDELKKHNLQKGILETKTGTADDPTHFTGGCAGCSCG